MELGFFETNINGREVIGHLGDTDYFHTSLHLFTKENTGFYVSFNSAGKEGASHKLRLALFADFADRYFPGPRIATRVDEATAKQHAQAMAGNWYASRGAFTTFFSAIGLIGQVKVAVDEKGQLLLADAKGLDGKPVKWIEVSPFVWQDANGHDLFAAKVVDGKPVRFSYGLAGPFEVFMRVPGSQDGTWLMPAVVREPRDPPAHDRVLAGRTRSCAAATAHHWRCRDARCARTARASSARCSSCSRCWPG